MVSLRIDGVFVGMNGCNWLRVGGSLNLTLFLISLFDAVVVFLDIVEMQYIVGITREGSFLCLKFGGTAF